jgi:hypothetical protein
MTKEQIQFALGRLGGPARSRYIAVVEIDNLYAQCKADAALLAVQDGLIWETLQAIEEASLGCPTCTRDVERRICAFCRAKLVCDRCFDEGRVVGMFLCRECPVAVCADCRAANLPYQDWEEEHFAMHLRFKLCLALAARERRKALLSLAYLILGIVAAVYIFGGG